MANLKQAIVDSVVQPYANSVFDTLLAEIVNYDTIKNRATIRFQNPKGTGTMELDNVPVQIGSGGIHSAGPFVGDHVWVSFQNKSPLHPKIVSLADEAYQYRTRERIKHSRKGAFIPDFICGREGYRSTSTVNSQTPAIDDWFDLDNEDAAKYSDYQNVNPIEAMISRTVTLSYYGSEEPGITHPLNSSTIKVRNNGMIDIFVATNQGLRIDPYTKTINVIGNTEKHHVTDFELFADESANLTTQRDLTLNAKRNLSLTGEKVSIATRSWTVVSDGDINLKSKSNITIDAAKDLILKGNLNFSRNEIIEVINDGGLDNV